MKQKIGFFTKVIIYSGLFVLLLVFVALSPIFCIKKIEVQGGEHYKKEDIIGVANLTEGNNWFKSISGKIGDVFQFKSSSIAESIKENRPYIKNVQVKYIFPRKCALITITEREPLFVVPYLGTNLLLDKESFVLENINDIKLCLLPIVRGLKFEQYELGKKLQVTNTNNMNALLRITSLITESDDMDEEQKKIYPLITNIDVSELSKLRIVVDTRIIMELGSYDDLNEYRINFLKQVYFTKISKGDKGSLMFSPNNDLKFIPYYTGGTN